MAAAKDMTNGNPLKLIGAFAIPLAFGHLFQQMYHIADTAIVGRILGEAMLGAVGCTGSVSNLIIGFCSGICFGFSIPIAQRFGAGDWHNLRKDIYHVIRLCTYISLVFAAVTGLFCPAIMRLMGTPDDIIEPATRYIRIIFIGIPVTVLYNMSSGILRALGDSKTPVLFLIAASIVNIVLDFFFIVPLHMSVEGAAIATVLGQLCSGIGCVYVLKKRFPALHGEADEKKTDTARLKQLLGIGVPMGLQYSLTAIGQVILQSSINNLGTIPVAAFSTGNRVATFFHSEYDALSGAMATYTAQNIGAGKIKRISKGIRSAFLIGGFYSLFAMVIMWFCGEFLVSIFVKPGDGIEVIRLGGYMLKVFSTMYIPLMTLNVLRLTIQGMGKTRRAMVAGVFEMIARSLVGIVLVPRLGFPGACLSGPVAWIMANIYLIPAYLISIKEVIKKYSNV